MWQNIYIYISVPNGPKLGQNADRVSNNISSANETVSKWKWDIKCFSEHEFKTGSFIFWQDTWSHHLTWKPKSNFLFPSFNPVRFWKPTHRAGTWVFLSPNPQTWVLAERICPHLRNSDFCSRELKCVCEGGANPTTMCVCELLLRHVLSFLSGTQQCGLDSPDAHRHCFCLSVSQSENLEECVHVWVCV